MWCNLRKRQSNNKYKKSNSKIKNVMKTDVHFDAKNCNDKAAKFSQEQIKLFERYIKKCNLSLSLGELISLYCKYINDPKNGLDSKRFCDLKKLDYNNGYRKFSNIMEKVIKSSALVDARIYNYEKAKRKQEPNKQSEGAPKKIKFPVTKEQIMLEYLDYLKNPTKDTDIFKVLSKFWTPSYNEHMLSYYNHALDNPSFSLFSLSAFTKDEFYENPGKEKFFNKFLIAAWLNDKKNQQKMLEICEKKLKRCLPEALEHYGVPDDYLFHEIPKDKFSKNLERYVFIHSDDFLDEMISAPKLPLTDWETIDRTAFQTIQVKKVAFRVGDEHMLGEFTRTFNYCNNEIIQNAGSGIKFCVYARGLEKGKFVVSRWDYEPLGVHYNKLNNYGNIDLNGYYCEKTQHSHAHIYTLKQRLLLGQNQSADVCPTPINCNSQKDEQVYGSFENMVKEFEWQHYSMEGKAPKFSHNFYLKNYISDMCPIEIRNGKYIYEDDLNENSRWNFKPKDDSQNIFLGKKCVSDCGKVERQLGE